MKIVAITFAAAVLAGEALLSPTHAICTMKPGGGCLSPGEIEARRLVLAQAQSQSSQAKPAKSDPFGGFGGNSKEPIRIDANKLEVFDKEQKAVYSGDVVAVRGTAVTRSTVMTIFYESKRNQEGGQRAQPAAQSAGTQDGALKRIVFQGPVSVVNGTQTMKADNMVYDAQAKVVTLRGNATVADGPNIQRGEFMTYNTETGIATITNPTAGGGRVQGVFTPGSQDDGAAKNKAQQPQPQTQSPPRRPAN